MYWAMGQFSGEGPMRSLPLPDDPNYARGRYATGRADWSSSDHWSRFGNVVQTLRQAVARIVRRAKWRRIIRALRMRKQNAAILAPSSRIAHFSRSAPRMWPVTRNPRNATNAQGQAFNNRMGFPTDGVGVGRLRGTGTRGWD